MVLRTLGSTLSLRDVAVCWAREGQFARSTLVTSRTHLNRHLLPAVGHRPLATLRTQEVRALIDGLELRPATRARVLGVLRSVCEFAVEKGWLAANPTRGVTVRGASVRKDLALPTIDQVADLCDAFEPKYRILVELMAFVGCGPSEAVAVRAGDLDFPGRRVHVRASSQLQHDGSRQISAAMKTEVRDRFVPVVPECVWNRWGGFAEHDPEALVAVSARGCVVRPDNFRARVFRPTVERVFGSATAVRPYDLRHFAVSLWLAAGHSMVDAATWAGHANAEMVGRIYGHPLPRSESAFEAEVMTQVLAGRSLPRLASAA